MLLILLFTQIILLKEGLSVSKWVSENSTFNVCCTVQLQDGEALVLKYEDTRLQVMVKTASGYERYPANDEEFIAKNPGWMVDSVEKTDSQLCAHQTGAASIEKDNNKTFTCELLLQKGLGRMSQRETIQIHVFRPVTIYDHPDVVRVRENETATLVCKAMGFPKLHLTWRSKETGTILRENEIFTDQSDHSLRLSLPNVTRAQHNTMYECEAQIDAPTGAEPAFAETRLEVTLPPKINLDSNTIHTDLGAKETFQIYVSGYPVPTLNCSGLTLGQPRNVSAEPQGGTRAYTATVEHVTEHHLTTFRCLASNEAGDETQEIEFTVAPSIPVILSPNWTELADYYLLKWLTQSRAPLANVTIVIEEYNSSMTSGTLVPRSTRRRKITYDLDPDTMDKTQTTLVLPNPNSPVGMKNPLVAYPWDNIGWHHVTNLSANTDHGLTLTVCNKYECTTSSSDPTTGVPSGIVFRTAEFTGSNTIQPNELALPPYDLAKLREQQPGVAVAQIGGRTTRSQTNRFVVIASVTWLICLIH